MKPDSAVIYIALIGMVVVAIFFVLEVRRWKDVSQVITSRQRAIRVTLIVLIELLFVMVLIGPWVLHKRDLVMQLVYWSVCLTMGLAVVVVALVDLLAVARGYAALNRRLFGDGCEDEQREDK